MALRKIQLTVGGAPIGRAKTWSYPAGDGKLYDIPTYTLEIVGTDGAGRRETYTYEVIRFGVNRKSDKETAKVVGLAEYQSYTVRAWLPTYSVHSARSVEVGAWHIFDNYLIHDGPDDPRGDDPPYATAGCIEVCGGPQGFDRFNDQLIKLAGSTKATRDEQLEEIGRSRALTLTYKAAKRPALVVWRA
jgi:hypothetical protein